MKSHRGAYYAAISGFYTRLQLIGTLEYIHRISKMAVCQTQSKNRRRECVESL